MLRKEEKFSDAEKAEVEAMGIRVRTAIAASAQNEPSKGLPAFR